MRKKFLLVAAFIYTAGIASTAALADETAPDRALPPCVAADTGASAATRGFFIPLFWFSKDVKFFTPLYASFSGKRDDMCWIFPLYFRYRDHEKQVSVKYKMLGIPNHLCAFHVGSRNKYPLDIRRAAAKQSEGRDVWTESPRHGFKLDFPFSLYTWEDSRFDVPYTYWRYDQLGADFKMIFPLWYRYSAPDDSWYYLFPFFFSRRWGNDENWYIEKAARHGFALDAYKEHAQKPDEKWIAAKGGPGTAWNALLLFSRVDAQDRQAVAFHPLVSYEKSGPRTEYAFLWPLFRWGREWSDDEKTGYPKIATPLFYHSGDPRDKNTWYFPIFFRNRRAGGTGMDIFWPFFTFTRHADRSGAVEVNRSVLYPLASWGNIRNAAREQIGTSHGVLLYSRKKIENAAIPANPKMKTPPLKTDVSMRSVFPLVNLESQTIVPDGDTTGSFRQTERTQILNFILFDHLFTHATVNVKDGNMGEMATKRTAVGPKIFFLPYPASYTHQTVRDIEKDETFEATNWNFFVLFERETGPEGHAFQLLWPFNGLYQYERNRKLKSTGHSFLYGLFRTYSRKNAPSRFRLFWLLEF